MSARIFLAETTELADQICVYFEDLFVIPLIVLIRRSMQSSVGRWIDYTLKRTHVLNMTLPESCGCIFIESDL